MTPAYRTLESVPYPTAFGVRFWDDSIGLPVNTSGLEVALYPQFNPALRARVDGGLGGGYVARRLPWTPAQSAAFEVEVHDPAGDFLPIRFAATLPSASRFRLACGSPAPGPFVPLFSSPGRTVPAAMAVVRADLWDIVHGRPAAGALLEITPAPGLRARGMADQRGSVSVIFGYPEPVRFTGFSPGDASGLPLDQQTWTAGLRVFYAAATAWPRDLCEVLNQPLGTAWVTSAATTALTSVLLRMGAGCVARSLDAVTLQSLPRLLVNPGA